MTPQEMWNAYKQINPSIGDEIDAWAFGVEPDLLADLVFKGGKNSNRLSLRSLRNRGRTPSTRRDLRCYFRQPRSSCLHCRSYKGFRSAFPSSVSRPCLQGRRRRQISGLLASGS